MSKIKNISFSKLLGKIFVLLLVINLIIGTDLAMTGVGISITPTNDLVSRTDWAIVDDLNIEFQITLDIPNEGYIPKGVKLNMQVFVTHPGTELFDDKINRTEITLGERLDLDILVVLSATMKNLFSDTGFVNYEFIIQIIPVYFNSVLESGLRTISISGRI